MSTRSQSKKKQPKKPKTVREQCALDMQQMEERLSTNFDSKLDRIHQAIAAMAPDPGAPTATTNTQPPPPKRTCHPTATATLRSQVLNPNEDNQNFIINSQEITSNSTFIHRDRPSALGIDGEPTQTRPHTSSGSTLTPDLQVPRSASALNINKPETSWIIGQALSAKQGQHHIPPPSLPISAVNLDHDDDIEARVSHILSSTAHHLSANNGKMGLFPHKFVQRGPERKHPAFNTLSLPEHCFGIFMMIRDD